jgi:hypothetical protein
MYKRLLYFGLFCTLFWGCHKKIAHYLVLHSDDEFLETKKLERSYRSDCRSISNYIPDSTSLLWGKDRKIRVNFHFLDATNSVNNIPIADAEKWAKGLIKNANSRLKQNAKMRLPEGNDTPVYPANYKYVLSKNDSTNHWFHYHYDDTLFYVITRGKNRNIFDKDVLTKYKIGQDSILNIFVMPHHPDSIRSSTYKTHTSGVSYGNLVKVTGALHEGMKDWKMATNLNHEIGHSLGLAHTWSGRDGCDDTPKHSNCWSSSKKDDKCHIASNNLMDYNNSQMAITPCQLGKVNKILSDELNPRRKLVIKDWCQLDTSQTIVIADSVRWNAHHDVYHNIVVEDGGVLELCCRTSMPENSSITVKLGGTLKLIANKLYNDCALTWHGIIVEQQGDKRGRVVKLGKVEILDTPIISR